MRTFEYDIDDEVVLVLLDENSPTGFDTLFGKPYVGCVGHVVHRTFTKNLEPVYCVNFILIDKLNERPIRQRVTVFPYSLKSVNDVKPIGIEQAIKDAQNSYKYIKENKNGNS